jgi:hypothetical protein
MVWGAFLYPQITQMHPQITQITQIAQMNPQMHPQMHPQMTQIAQMGLSRLPR